MESYSQCGEDLIINFIFDALKIPFPTFLDLGAYHPIFLSNTYLFYQKGCQGVCVEPDPTLCAEIKNVRPRDICLNIGVGTNNIEKAELYIITTRTLNTFSRQTAENIQSQGCHKIEEIIQIPMVPVNQIIEQYFTPSPNFISLDAEGMDLEIIQSFDFAKFRPQVFSIETLSYSDNKTEKKITEFHDLMGQYGYFAYADSYINTIYVEKTAWDDR